MHNHIPYIKLVIVQNLQVVINYETCKVIAHPHVTRCTCVHNMYVRMYVVVDKLLTLILLSLFTIVKYVTPTHVYLFNTLLQ